MEKIFVIVLAGGAGERLYPLTQGRSKASVPFGGKYRLIDFTLSNCILSGLRQIFVLTQYRSGSLQSHIQEGWGISGSGLGEFVYCVPPQHKLSTDWYRGTADAVRQNIDLIKKKGVRDVLILSGDHVYKMDYSQFVAYHRLHNASLTIAAIRAEKEEAAGRLGVLETDEHHKLVGFEEKPAQPKTMPENQNYALASMGVYVFKVAVLLDVLKGQEEDFGRHIIPKMIGKYNDIYTYDFEGENKIEDMTVEVKDGVREKVAVARTHDSSYWKDVGTIDSYYEASMDLVGVDPAFNLYGEKWLFRTFQRPLPPSKFILGGKALESIVSDGCIISGGTVWNSVLSPGVIVERGATVDQSIIFDDVMIEPGARIKRAIIDKESRIRAGATVGYDRELDLKRGCTISDNRVVIVPKGADIYQTEQSLF